MTDHVPGPWHSSKTSVVCFYGTRRIQVATARQPLFTLEAQAANARLIAAAPDLLAALQAVADYWAGGDVPQVIGDAMQAAIAKATGQ
jgi:hypothetical protein